MAVYVVDSNFFIQAHRATYPLDIATSFWNKVRELANNENIISIDKVKSELYDKNDELEFWCKNNLPNNFFADSSTSLAEYGRISSWATSRSNHYMPNAINEFLNVDEADAFLVAFTLADLNNRILVTQEISNPYQKNKIKIPEPCNEFGVTFVNTITMFRQLGVTF